GERVEMVVDIYESTDAVRGQEPSTRMEDTSPKTTQQTQHPGSRCCGPAAVGLGLLCVLLLVVITVLWIKFTKEKDQLQSSYTNLTVERDQLQTSYTNLTTGRDQLQTRYTNLTVERDQLQTSYTNLTKERDQLQKERDEFSRRLSELETLITQQEWIYFSSSIYYISTEKKSWRESRQHCKDKGADLVIINSKEEQDFINRLRGDQTAWIGLSYRTWGGRWRWVDDSAVDTGTEELNRGERVEMVVDIYESTDAVRAQEPTTKMEDTSPKTTQQTQHPDSVLNTTVIKVLREVNVVKL
ncbi:hypothetical protein NFI96_032454, partial [Prochilodus magdalenae]